MYKVLFKYDTSNDRESGSLNLEGKIAKKTMIDEEKEIKKQGITLNIQESELNF